MKPKVSVLMPVFNGERWLSEAVESILSQSYADFELVIVDDCSNDNSLEIIKFVGSCDSRIRYITHEQNRGAAAAYNTAYEASKGEYVTGMDCDDISLPGRLRKQVQFLASNPDIGAVGVSIQMVDPDLKPLQKYVYPETHSLIAWNVPFGRCMSGAPAMMRRTVLEAVGGYNDNSGNSQDYDLLSRLLGRARLANMPDILYLYRRHEHSATFTVIAEMLAAVEVSLEKMLTRLWGETPEKTTKLFLGVRSRIPCSNRAEHRFLRTEMYRLMDSMVDAGWIDATDIPLVETQIERDLKVVKPRFRPVYRVRVLLSRIKRRLLGLVNHIPIL